MRRFLGQRLRSAANLAGLGAVQFANALVPIVIFPLALHHLGVADYATLVTAEAVSIIVSTAVLYSFEIEGVTRGTHLRLQEDSVGMAQLAASIMWARVLIWATATLIVIAAAYLTDFVDPEVLIGWLLVPLGYAFFGNCIYQAHERTFRLGMITLGARLLSIALVLLMPISSLGPVAVSLALGVSFLTGGLIAAANMYYELRLSVVRPSYVTMRELMRSGWQIFLGNISVILYRDVNVLMLGVLGSSSTAIAAYSIAEKFVKLVQATIRPFTQFMFPRAVERLQREERPNRATFKILAQTVRVQWLLLVGMLAILAIALAVILKYWPETSTIYGLAHVDALIMLPAIFLGVANFMFGTVGLNTLGERTALLVTLVVTGLASILGLGLLTTAGVSHAAGLMFVGSEALLLTLVLMRFRGNGPQGQ